MKWFSFVQWKEYRRLDQTFGFVSVSSHVASNSRHIRIFCDSIWNILHNPFVFEHRLLVLAEYISPLLLVLLWFEIWMVSKNMFETLFCGWGMISSPGGGPLSIFCSKLCAIFDVQPRLNYWIYPFSFSWLACYSVNEEIRLKTLFLVFEKDYFLCFYEFIFGGRRS